jgi:pimeloyl-ACP methyl ester carboxylesterase
MGLQPRIFDKTLFASDQPGELPTPRFLREPTVPDPTIFHWSGKNSETERRRAGRLLAQVIEKLEKKGEPYALIGHSHGGSVIWHALIQLRLGRREMGNLRSVVTLGTPFLVFAPGNAWLRQLLVIVVAIWASMLLLSFWTGIANQWFDLYKSGEFAALTLAVTSAVLCAVLLALSLRGLGLCVWNALVERRRRGVGENLALTLGKRLLCISLPSDEAINVLALMSLK